MSTLKGCTLGIDASYFVSKMLDYQNHREPLLPATGGFPCGLEASLDSFISSLKEKDIEPVFVLKGMSLNSSDSTPNASAAQVARRERAWNLYEKQKGDESVVGFNEAASYDSYSDRHFVNLLIARNVRYLAAPFTASAQLALMSQDRQKFTVEKKTAEDGTERISVITAAEDIEECTIDAIFGSTDCLVYANVDKLIVSIDPSATNFHWVSKREFLSDINLTADMFTELAVAVGCELNSITFPLIEGMYQQQLANNQHMTYIKLALDLINAHGSIYSAILAFPDTDGSIPFLSRFERGVSCAEYQPVLYSSGNVWPYRSDYIPADIHEFVGQRLPDEVMFYHSKGLIGPELLTALISAELTIDAPLDGGESKEYRSFLMDNQRKLWGYSLSFLTQILHRYYQFKPVKPKFWFDSANQPEHSFERIQPPLYIKFGNSWRVQHPALVESSFTDLNTITAVIELIATDDNLIAASKARSETKIIFESDDEIMFNTFARTLQAAGFINSDHALTSWGKVVAAALSNSEDPFDEEIFVAISLLKAGVLNSKPFEPAYSGAPLRGTPEDRRHTLLVSRIASILKLRHKSVGFSGPLSRSLLSFQSFVASQVKSYRWLAESVLVSLLSNGDADRLSRTDKDWYRLAYQLPFSEIPACSNGIAVKTYLDEVLAHDGDCDAAKTSITNMLQMASSPLDDISRSFSFFDSIVAGVQQASDLELLPRSIVEEFTSTQNWLSKFRFD